MSSWIPYVQWCHVMPLTRPRLSHLYSGPFTTHRTGSCILHPASLSVVFTAVMQNIYLGLSYLHKTHLQIWKLQQFASFKTIYVLICKCSEFIIILAFPAAVSGFVSSWGLLGNYHGILLSCIVIITHGRDPGLTIPSDISATPHPGGGSPY